MMSAIDMTAKTLFQRLYLVLGLCKIAPWVNCPHPQPQPFTLQLFLDFLAIFSPEWPLIFLVITIYQVIWPSSGTHPPSPSKFTLFCFAGFSSYEDIFYFTTRCSLFRGKSESRSSSEVRNYDHYRWETNKQMRETNTPCVPIDVFLFYHWERCEKVDHVRHRGLKECVVNRFSPRPYFACLFRAGPFPPSLTPQICCNKWLSGCYKWFHPDSHLLHLHNPRSYTCPPFDVSLTPQKHAVL